MAGGYDVRRVLLASLFVVISAAALSAQIVVHDRATTLRNSIIAMVKEFLLNTQREQHRQIREMARRLSALTNLDKYAVPDPPRWRTHGSDEFLFSQAYNEALIFGDPAGTAYLSLTQPVVAAQQVLSRLNPGARRAIASQLATVDLADATTIAGTNDTGQLRLSGRKKELPAIDALEAHVIDPSDEQSATAVLDKITGAVLVGARQRQARMQLLAGVVEQLLVDSKRARDTETAAMNMQLVTLRDAKSANKAFAKGTGDALRTWRQP
jgi:hypothetical protein